MWESQYSQRKWFETVKRNAHTCIYIFQTKNKDIPTKWTNAPTYLATSASLWFSVWFTTWRVDVLSGIKTVVSVYLMCVLFCFHIVSNYNNITPSRLSLLFCTFIAKADCCCAWNIQIVQLSGFSFCCCCVLFCFVWGWILWFNKYLLWKEKLRQQAEPVLVLWESLPISPNMADRMLLRHTFSSYLSGIVGNIYLVQTLFLQDLNHFRFLDCL